VSRLAWGLFDPGSGTEFGGAESQMHALAVALARDDAYDVSFVLQDFGQPREIVIDRVRVIRCSRPFKDSRLLRPMRWLVVGVTSFTRVWGVDADVYIESPAGFPTAHCAITAGLRKRTFIYRMASDGDLLVMSPRRTVGPKAVWERRAFAWAFPRADGILARNEHQRAELRRRYGKSSMILPNVFDVPDRPAQVVKDSVLWVASAQALKQPWIFIDLARAFPAVPFVMVMPPSDQELFMRIRAQGERLPNLTLVERVPFSEIQDHFDRALVFINTSTVEGFPNTFVQAAIGATPVLSLSVNPDEVLDTHGFGRCAGGDYDCLRSDLDELLADQALREKMGAAGFAYAAATHDVSLVMRRLKDYLDTFTSTRVD
jgi:glycosyltransferase involved in cell wall biosynthesis